MSTVLINSFNGLTVNGSSNYGLDFRNGQTSGYKVTRNKRQRRGRSPVRDALFGEVRPVLLDFVNVNAAVVTDGAFKTLAGSTFDNLRGPYTVLGQHPQTGASVQLSVDVLNAQPSAESPHQKWEIDCEAVDALWQATSATTPAAATSGTLTNGGNVRAFPRLSLAPTVGSCLMRTVTVTDRCGRGFRDYWVRCSFSVSGTGCAAASNYYVFFDGQLIPFWFQLSGSTAYIDVRLKAGPNAATSFDVFYHSSFANSVTANRLDQAQLDYTDLTNLTNTAIHWNNYTLTSAPQGCAFALTPQKVGQSLSGVSYGLISEGNLNCTFAIKGNSSLAGDADSLVTVLGTAADTGTGQLKYLSRVLTCNKAPGANEVQRYDIAGGATLGGVVFTWVDTNGAPHTSYNIPYNANAAAVQGALESIFGSGNVTVALVSGSTFDATFAGAYAQKDVGQVQVIQDGTHNGAVAFNTRTEGSAPSARAFVRYRLPGQLNWTDAWTTTVPGTYTSNIDIPSGVQIAIGLEPLTADCDATLLLQNASAPPNTFQVAMSSSLTPSVSVGAAVTAWQLNGVLTNSTTGRTVTFNQVFIHNTTLVVDCDTQDITTLDGSAVYGEISFSDADLWWALDPGNNSYTTAFTLDGSGSVTVPVAATWHDRFQV